MSKTKAQIEILILGYTNTVIQLNFAYVIPKTSWEDEIKELPATDNQVRKVKIG